MGKIRPTQSTSRHLSSNSPRHVFRRPRIISSLFNADWELILDAPKRVLAATMIIGLDRRS